MKIKAVEELLGLSRANIRFYEDKGLLSPDRSENRYREYDDTDIERLKKIIILRKMGVSIDAIGELFEGKAELSAVLQKQSNELKAEIDRLSGALALCDSLAESGVSIDTLDEDACMAAIGKAEEEGRTFVDICKDFLEFEENAFMIMWKYVFFHNFESTRSRHGRKGVAIAVLIICILRGLAKQFIWKDGSFFEGFFYPFMLFFGVSLIIAPIYLLGRKHPKIAGTIASVLLVICIAFLALALLFIILGLFGVWS